MKKKYTKYFILLSVIAISVIIRETIFSNLNYFTAKTSSNSDYHCSEKSLTIDVEDDGVHQHNMLFEKHAYILVSGKDTILNATGYGKPIVWNVEKLEMNNGITPFYRNIKFSSKIVCKTDRTIIKLKNNKLRSIQSDINATIRVSGNSEVTGLSSVSNNKKIVNDCIVKVVEEKTLEMLKALDHKYGI